MCLSPQQGGQTGKWGVTGASQDSSPASCRAAAAPGVSAEKSGVMARRKPRPRSMCNAYRMDDPPPPREAAHAPREPAPCLGGGGTSLATATLATTWPTSFGNHLATGWQLLANQLAITWQPAASYFATSWPLVGKQLATDLATSAATQGEG